MPKCPGMMCLLLAFVHLCLRNMECDADDKRDLPEDSPSCSEPGSNPHISSPSSETTLGANVTIMCSSNTSCLPVSVVLFLNKSVHPAVKSKKQKHVIFNFTINSISELGEYKCRANQTRFRNMTKFKYSSGFSFTLREQKNNLGVPVVFLSLMLLLLITIALAIPLLILFWRKARKARKASVSASFITANYPDSENCTTNDNIAVAEAVRSEDNF